MNEEMIVRKYADMVYKIAYRYMGNPTDAEDVFSETFLAYFRKERTFDGEEHRKAWFIRVTINCAKEQLKKRPNWAELDPERDSDETVYQPGTDQETLLDLRQAVNALKPLYREVICLYYLEELSVSQVAQILGRSENAVKTQLLRGRAALKTYLSGR